MQGTKTIFDIINTGLPWGPELENLSPAHYDFFTAIMKQAGSVASNILLAGGTKQAVFDTYNQPQSERALTIYYDADNDIIKTSFQYAGRVSYGRPALPEGISNDEPTRNKLLRALMISSLQIARFYEESVPVISTVLSEVNVSCDEKNSAITVKVKKELLESFNKVADAVFNVTDDKDVVLNVEGEKDLMKRMDIEQIMSACAPNYNRGVMGENLPVFVLRAVYLSAAQLDRACAIPNISGQSILSVIRPVMQDNLRLCPKLDVLTL